MHVQPLGVLVITDDAERWVPILDVTRLALAGSAVLITGLLTLRAIYRQAAEVGTVGQDSADWGSCRSCLTKNSRGKRRGSTCC